MKSVVVLFDPWPEMRPGIESALDGVADITYLTTLDEGERSQALENADALLSWDLGRELHEEELRNLASVELVQLLSAGANHVPFALLPPDVPVAANAGAYARPIAEHVLAMTLALAKRLPQNDAALASGVFDQQTRTRELRGSTVAILGYGGIGRASADLFRAFGARIHAVTRSGDDDGSADAVSALAELGVALQAADVVVISLPLTRATRGLIGPRELALMKPHAILVNVARGEILDEDALYDHLQRVPTFSAGLDVWWDEPGTDGAFRPRHPFVDLPNVIGSPHVSGNTEGSLGTAAGQAAENIARFLRGESPLHLVDRSEYGG